MVFGGNATRYGAEVPINVTAINTRDGQTALGYLK
jgi:hypothetical protein